MLNVRAPNQPIRSWRDFFIHIATISVGILIALLMEQAFEVIRDYRTSREAREAIKLEIGKSLFRINSRLNSQSCLDERLKELGDILSRTQDSVMTPQPTWVSRPQYWTFSAGAWAAAAASGRATLLNKTELGYFGYVYQRLEALEREEEREQSAWAHLRGLESWRGPLGPVARTAFTQALQEARYSSYRVHSIAIGLLDLAKQTDIAIVEIPGLQFSRGICLPITETREHAVSISGGPTGDPE